MIGWHHRLNGDEFEQPPGDTEGQGSLECFSPWGHEEPDMTKRLNNNKVASINRFQQLPRHSIVTLYFKTHDFFFFLNVRPLLFKSFDCIKTLICCLSCPGVKGSRNPRTQERSCLPSTKINRKCGSIFSPALGIVFH